MRTLRLTTALLGSLIGIFGFLVGWSATACAESKTAQPYTTEQNIDMVFAELRTLKMMLARKHYTVRVAGKKETGAKERFLRRRTAEEVAKSGLSSGCGDYGMLFIERIEPKGFETLLIDAVEISSLSLRYHFSGHVVVAIRGKDSPQDAPWWLIDPTSRRILSRNWLPTEKHFQVSGRSYWIGYCGPRSGYPVNNERELTEFYEKTLGTVPDSVLNGTLFRIQFKVDPSLMDADGNYLNARLHDFIRAQSALLTANHIKPGREVSITLKKGGDTSESKISYSDEEGWVGQIGLQSGCSPSLLAYFEQAIHRSEQHNQSKIDATPN